MLIRFHFVSDSEPVFIDSDSIVAIHRAPPADDGSFKGTDINTTNGLFRVNESVDAAVSAVASARRREAA